MPNGKDYVLRRKLCPTQNNGCQAERLPVTTVRILDAWLALAWAMTKARGAVACSCRPRHRLRVFSLFRIGVLCHSVVS